MCRKKETEEKKNDLHKRFDELESLYDTTRGALDVLRTALAKSQGARREGHWTGGIHATEWTKEATFVYTLTEL